MNGAGEIDEPGGAVTVLVARRVVPGREIEFEKWASELTRAASSFDGFLGAGLLRPGHVGELWHVVYRFASADDLARWEQSQTRSDLLAELGSRVSNSRVYAADFAKAGLKTSDVPKFDKFESESFAKPQPLRTDLERMLGSDGFVDVEIDA